MRMLVGAVLLTISSMSLAQYAPMLNEALLREAMEDVVENPSSATFDYVTYKRNKDADDWTVCGRVSLKTAHGSDAGTEYFIGMVAAGEDRPYYYVFSVGGLSDQLCQLEGL